MFLPKNITVDGISEKVLIAKRKSPKWRKSDKKVTHLPKRTRQEKLHFSKMKDNLQQEFHSKILM
jgi:hypothetical protein